jgi:hypothetical protein
MFMALSVLVAFGRSALAVSRGGPWPYGSEASVAVDADWLCGGSDHERRGLRIGEMKNPVPLLVLVALATVGQVAAQETFRVFAYGHEIKPPFAFSSWEDGSLHLNGVPYFPAECTTRPKPFEPRREEGLESRVRGPRSREARNERLINAFRTGERIGGVWAFGCGYAVWVDPGRLPKVLPAISAAAGGVVADRDRGSPTMRDFLIDLALASESQN